MADGPSFPEPHVIPPTSTHTHTIILLHGRGSNGEEFAEELFQGETFSGESLRRHFPGFRWIFPSAHESFSTVFREDLVEWFDIYSLTDPSLKEELQIDGLRQSVAFVQGLIDKEVQILGPFGRGRVILGGISQGCAVAITALLSGTCGVGAFVGFNGWMPFVDRVKELVSGGTDDRNDSKRQKCGKLAAALRSSLSHNGIGNHSASARGLDDHPATSEAGHPHTPIFLSHTVDDGIVDIALGKKMRETLTEMGLHNIVWKEYETGGHWITEPEGFEHLVEFLSETFGIHGQRMTNQIRNEG